MKDTRQKVELLVDGKMFRGWTDFELKLSMDAFDTVRFSAPFDAFRRVIQQSFEPFAYRPVKVAINGAIAFNGTMIGVEPNVDKDSSSLTVTAYSLPGVLCDCTAPSGFGRKGKSSKEGPIGLSFTKLSLIQIATTLCSPFGIRVEADASADSAGTPFKQAAIKLEQKIHDFLIELAKQRGLVVTNTPEGNLFLWKSVTERNSDAVAQLFEGTAPLTKVTASFSPQDYFSEITGYVTAKHRKPGCSYTVLNPWLGAGIDAGTDPINTHRPMSFTLDDIERADGPAAVKAKAGRMFANSVSYAIDEMPGWLDQKGDLWTPNTLIKLTAQSAMIYSESIFLIREVALKQNANAETASLGLVLPGVFSGEIPKKLPWHDAPDLVGF